MKRALLWTFALTLCAAALCAQSDDLDSRPRYAGKSLIRPEHYREWMFLSSGLGMNYSPAPGRPEQFTNVFVPRWSYRQFLATGKWPDQSVFVVEERESQGAGSINKSGHFQTNLAGLGVEVKDERRFPDRWAYFTFSSTTQQAAANPKSACWQCHEDHAAVEHTFVQFYPTLKDVAKKFGAYRDTAESAAP